MKIILFDKKCYVSRFKIEFIFISLITYNFLFNISNKNYNGKKDIKIALCTMGKEENLYVEEFIEYYIKLGIDHIFIYDDNDPNKEQIYKAIDKKYQYYVTFQEAKKFNIYNQSIAFSECYNHNKNKFDWFLMFDMDEFLYIVDDSLKGYLTNKRFNKCDFIKIHWVFPTDNNLIYYDSRPLFERFKPPYIKSEYIKSIIRGNISNIKFRIHSPTISPERNITCNNIGKRIYYDYMSFPNIRSINIKKAYIIHFRYKSTEEFIHKLKRGYSNWVENNLKFVIEQIKIYLFINKATPEKVKFIEKELHLNLSNFIKNIYKQKFKKFSGIIL